MTQGFNLGVSGAWKAARPFVGVSGAWKSAKAVFIGVGGVWKQVYSSAPPALVTSITPAIANWEGGEEIGPPGSGSYVYSAGPFTVSVAGGTPPYTYTWTASGGYLTSPTSTSTGLIFGGGPGTTTLQCTVTDSIGVTATPTATVI
jgi:hypothetical protein